MGETASRFEDDLISPSPVLPFLLLSIPAAIGADDLANHITRFFTRQK